MQIHQGICTFGAFVIVSKHVIVIQGEAVAGSYLLHCILILLSLIWFKYYIIQISRGVQTVMYNLLVDQAE